MSSMNAKERQPPQLYVVRCTATPKHMSEPMVEFNAGLVRDYYNDSQGEDYCIGDHYLERWPKP